MLYLQINLEQLHHVHVAIWYNFRHGGIHTGSQEYNQHYSNVIDAFLLNLRANILRYYSYVNVNTHNC